MKIYREMLNEIFSIDVDQNVWVDENSYKSFLQMLELQVELLPEEVRKIAIKTINGYVACGFTYIIHKFKNYYAISRQINDYYPQEIDTKIKVFDKNREYPLQEIELVLDWKY